MKKALNNKIKMLRIKMANVEELIELRQQRIDAAWNEGRFAHYHTHRYAKMELEARYETLYNKLEELILKK